MTIITIIVDAETSELAKQWRDHMPNLKNAYTANDPRLGERVPGEVRVYAYFGGFSLPTPDGHVYRAAKAASRYEDLLLEKFVGAGVDEDGQPLRDESGNVISVTDQQRCAEISVWDVSSLMIKYEDLRWATQRMIETQAAQATMASAVYMTRDEAALEGCGADWDYECQSLREYARNEFGAKYILVVGPDLDEFFNDLCEIHALERGVPDDAPEPSLPEEAWCARGQSEPPVTSSPMDMEVVVTRSCSAGYNQSKRVHWSPINPNEYTRPQIGFTRIFDSPPPPEPQSAVDAFAKMVIEDCPLDYTNLLLEEVDPSGF